MSDETYRAFKEAVRVANQIRRTIESLVRDHDVVAAVWADKSERDGVGMMIIKGQQRLREIAISEPGKVSFIAIQYVAAEQAEALRRVAGEPDSRL